MSPDAKRLLQEYTYQRDKEKRRERAIKFMRDYAWIPLGFVFTWILWKAFGHG